MDVRPLAVSGYLAVVTASVVAIVRLKHREAELLQDLRYVNVELAVSDCSWRPPADPQGPEQLPHGRRTVNVQPTPRAVRSSIPPSWASTIDLAMASPSPAPPVERALESSPR